MIITCYRENRIEISSASEEVFPFLWGIIPYDFPGDIKRQRHGPPYTNDLCPYNQTFPFRTLPFLLSLKCRLRK